MTTPYDAVIYPNLCQAQTHPDRLAVVANLFGLNPAPPECCRVLEIGCGDGSNLLPLAAAFPQSTFVGFDLAETLIQAAQAAVADLGVDNLELTPADILQFPMQGEPFDYIIAHGIYSWIPDAAKAGLLRLCQHRLAPAGVAYISYNCLPGCHLRRMTRDIMRFHTRDLQGPAARVQQAVAVCRFIANSIEKPDAYRQVFKEQLEQIERYRAGHLFHDDLAEINDPVYFHEFAAHAAQHGLQFLGEADFFEMQDDAFSDEARQILARMQDSRVTREQYLDFVKCRRFRQTLLCRSEVALTFPAEALAVERFHVSSQAAGTGARQLPGGQSVERFADTRGGAIETGHPLAIHALRRLKQIWPATLSFSDLFASAWAAGPLSGVSVSEARWQLMLVLLEAYRAAVVEFRRVPIRCAPAPSEKPATSRFARWQLSRAATVTTLRYDNLRIEDEVGKRLFLLLDGTRTLGELEQSLPPTRVGADGKDLAPREQLQGRLAELAGLALLES